MKKLHGLSICLLYLQTFLCLGSSKRIIQEAGASVTIPCRVNPTGNITWNKDNMPILKIVKGMPRGLGKDTSRFKVPDRSTNNLEITGVQLTDSGNYTCLKDTQTWTEELVVLQVEAIPLGTLLATEDLTLTIQYPSQMPLTVSWWKDKKISDGPVLKKKNLQIEDSGMYTYRVKMDVGEEKVFEKQIEVKGFYHSQSIVYTTGKRPVTIPWFFNFNVRQTPLEKDAKVLEGNITFSSQMIKPLTIDNGAVCWQKSCDTKSGDSKNLSYYLKSPKNGTYRMEIVLQIDGRQKHLRRDVCVANLTVSSSENIMSMESNVSLQCNIDCLDKKGKLCWYHHVIGQQVCGPPGQKTFTKKFTVLQDTVGNWTCSVFIGEEVMVSVNWTLVVTFGIFHPSKPLVWVTLAAGVLVFLFIVVIISVMAARCRRMRRARYRAWLMENLHHQRMCECNGFAPKRLRENI